jgi:acetyltransferase-like isoleucine patch superfamily enzyme
VHLITAVHNVQHPIFIGKVAKVVFEDYVFIGTQITILSVETISNGAVVIACVCVTNDMPPITDVGGIIG